MVYLFLYICVNKNKNMRNKGILMMASIGLFAASCSSDASVDGEESNEVESVVYNLDKEKSILKWHGEKNAEYGHDGTVMFSEGSLTMKGNDVEAGTFVVDMNSVKNTDIPEKEKGESLSRHLMGLDDNDYHKPEDFFNSPLFPTVEVTLGDYNDGNLNITLSILGKELTQDVAVEISNDDASASINGQFDLDLKSLEIPGFQPDPETGEGISPTISFDLDLKLKK